MHYIAIIEKEPGTLVSVWFPDCPGAAAAGNTMEEATTSAVVALRLWAAAAVDAGEALPSARSVDALLSDRDIAASCAAGGVMVAIPLIVDQGRQTRVNISLDVGALTAIDEAARRKGVTRSAFMVEAAKDAAARLA